MCSRVGQFLSAMILESLNHSIIVAGSFLPFYAQEEGKRLDTAGIKPGWVTRKHHWADAPLIITPWSLGTTLTLWNKSECNQGKFKFRSIKCFWKMGSRREHAAWSRGHGFESPLGFCLSFHLLSSLWTGPSWACNTTIFLCSLRIQRILMRK